MLDLIKKEIGIMNDEIRQAWMRLQKNVIILFSPDCNYEEMERKLRESFDISIDYICINGNIRERFISLEDMYEMNNKRLVTVLLTNMDRTLWFNDYTKCIDAGFLPTNILNYFQLSYMWTFLVQNEDDYLEKYLKYLKTEYNQKTKVRRSFCTFHNLAKCKEVYDLLSDEESRKIYLRLISKRIMRCKFYDDLYKSNQYFDESIVKFSHNDIFFDVGAYDGDTISLINEKTHGKYKAIYAFEPDDNVFLQLIENTRKYKRISYFNAGLFNKSGALSFKNCSLGSSHIVPATLSDEGNSIKPVIKGDEMNLNPTFIKMDIEGAELSALEGLKMTIKQEEPTLAICIYHKVDDLWKIPLYIHKINPKYRLYIRHHSYTDCETVCYAVACI